MAWTTKSGNKISIEDMSFAHVQNSLKMLISEYTIVCISMGAKYAPQIKIDQLSEKEARDMLIKTCTDRKYLKKIVTEQCFGPIIWEEIKDLFV